MTMTFSKCMSRGYKHNKSENFADAISDFTQALALDPLNVRAYVAYNNRGYAYQQQGKFDEAILDYTKSIELNPKYTTGYVNRANAYMLQGKFDEAILDYRNALALEPENATLYLGRAWLYSDQGKFDEAILDFSKILELDPKYPNAHLYRGNIYKSQQKWDEAILDYNKAIALNPTNAVTYNNRAVAFEPKGQFDEALSDYNKAIELDPKYAIAYQNRAFFYKEKNKLAEAILDFNQALKIGFKDLKMTKECEHNLWKLVVSNRKRYILDAIKKLDTKLVGEDRIISLLHQILKDKKSIVGERFWQREGVLPCRLTSGTLKEINTFYTSLTKDKVEVRKAARLIDQATRDTNSLFSKLPRELCIEIAKKVATNLDEEKATKIAVENLKRPSSKK